MFLCLHCESFIVVNCFTSFNKESIFVCIFCIALACIFLYFKTTETYLKILYKTLEFQVDLLRYYANYKVRLNIRAHDNSNNNNIQFIKTIIMLIIH